MRRFSSLVALAAVAVAAAACGSGGSGGSGAGSSSTSLVPIGAGLEGPRGLTARVYAKGLPRMSAFASDARGRLWVATSGATSNPGDAVTIARPHRAAVVSLRVASGLAQPARTAGSEGT